MVVIVGEGQAFRRVPSVAVVVVIVRTFCKMVVVVMVKGIICILMILLDLGQTNYGYV